MSQLWTFYLWLKREFYIQYCLIYSHTKRKFQIHWIHKYISWKCSKTYLNLCYHLRYKYYEDSRQHFQKHRRRRFRFCTQLETDLLSKIKDCFDVILLYLNFSMELELCLSVLEELVLFRYRGSESSQGEVQPRVQGCWSWDCWGSGKSSRSF